MLSVRPLSLCRALLHGHSSGHAAIRRSRPGSGLGVQRDYGQAPPPPPSSPAARSPSPPGPGLEFFLANSSPARPASCPPPSLTPPYLSEDLLSGQGRKVYFDVYGCQMNVNDMEVVRSVLHARGFERTTLPAEADVWLIVTCSIREGAEAKIWSKLRHIQGHKRSAAYKRGLKVGLLGCMAERLKDKLLTEDRLVDVVAGPDAYKDLPRLLAQTSHTDEASINVMLSMDETYADIMPMRLDEGSVTGFVSIQRGCDNMCSYCIVPFTRGRERSRPVTSIVNEVRYLAENGVKEVTLLGQNVNSYRDVSKKSQSIFTSSLSSTEPTHLSAGFRSIYKPKTGGIRFADLLDTVSQQHPEVRFRFVSPHPKDFPDEVLHLISERKNVCKHIHLPAQCGSTRVLQLMRRGYSRESYLELVDHIRSIIPDVTLCSDFIAGFCGETDQEFEETLSLIKTVQYHRLYLFAYSLREKTHAHRKLQDDVPTDVKNQRCQRMVTLFRQEAQKLNQAFVGTDQLVLVEKDSRRSDLDLQGRTDGNLRMNFPKPGPSHSEEDVQPPQGVQPGDYCLVRVTEANSQGLKGTFLRKTTLQEEHGQSRLAAAGSE